MMVWLDWWMLAWAMVSLAVALEAFRRLWRLNQHLRAELARVRSRAYWMEAELGLTTKISGGLIKTHAISASAIREAIRANASQLSHRP